MLKLVLGASGSGKTTLLYARIRARAEAGNRSILLVPEQFTSSTEARIYRELGDALSGMVESYSFTSLAEHILAVEGGAAVQTLTDAGRAVLVRRALEELQDNVHYYYRHRRSAAFCQMAAETIDELKSAGLSGQQLQELARDCGTESAKLGELALIFQGYESLLAGTGMDPADRLELAADRLEAALARDELPDFLREREVFIDEFDTFNAPKKRLMGAMLAALPAVTVALCEDGAPMQPGDLELFSGAKQVAAQLRQLARKNGAQVAAPELLRRDLRHKDAPGLAALTELLETGSCPPPESAPLRRRRHPPPDAAGGALRKNCGGLPRYQPVPGCGAVRVPHGRDPSVLRRAHHPGVQRPRHGGAGAAGITAGRGHDRAADRAGQDRPVRPDRTGGLRAGKLRLHMVA